MACFVCSCRQHHVPSPSPLFHTAQCTAEGTRLAVLRTPLTGAEETEGVCNKTSSTSGILLQTYEPQGIVLHGLLNPGLPSGEKSTAKPVKGSTYPRNILVFIPHGVGKKCDVKRPVWRPSKGLIFASSRMDHQASRVNLRETPGPAVRLMVSPGSTTGHLLGERGQTVVSK